MTANEMRNTAILLYNSATPNEMAYNNTEWSNFLTLAQLRFVKERTFANRNPIGEGFEFGSKRDVELVELKRYVELLNNQGSKGEYPNSIVFTLPEDYLYNEKELVDITANATKYTDVQVAPINGDNYIEHLKSPFNKPYHRLVWRMTKATSVFPSGLEPNTVLFKSVIITGNNTVVDKYKFWYICYPPRIVCDTRTPANQKHCILNESTHEEIVRIAVQMALGATGNEKYQIATNERMADN